MADDIDREKPGGPAGGAAGGPAGGAPGEGDLSTLFLRHLPVNGTAVSTMGDLLGNETIAATDAQAARLDELQFDLGEGPCWDALRYRRPILEPDIRQRPQRVWAAFSPAISDQEVGALFAFPMLIGPLKIGAVDMYARDAVSLDHEQTVRAAQLTDIVARRVLQQALGPLAEDAKEAEGKYSRRIVHQATGMVLAQLGISPEDAHMVIRAHAFSTDQTMMDVSREILEGRLDFSVPENADEGF